MTSEDLADLSVSAFQKLFNVTAKAAEDDWCPESLVLNDAIYHTIEMGDIPRSVAEGLHNIDASIQSHRLT